MGPPELCQDLKASQPVLSVPLDAKDGAAGLSPAVQVAPLPVEHVHQALYLPAVVLMAIRPSKA